MHSDLAAWQVALRGHVFPLLKSSTLLALEAELESGGHHLIHRQFCDPPPLHALSDRKPVAYCLLGYCAAQEAHTETGEQVQEWIADLGGKVGYHTSCAVMNFWDSSGAAMPELHDCVVREKVLSEVREELASRTRLKTA